MKGARHFLGAFSCTLLVGVALATQSASAIGFDSASDLAYTLSWDNGDNGGSGFLGWFLNTSGVPGSGGNASAGFFTGTAYNATMGTSFGLYANSPDGSDSPQAEAIRSFSPGLGVGLSFSFQMSWNFRNGFKGFDLRSGGTSMIRFETSDNFGVGNEIQLRNLIASNSVSLFSGNYSADALFNLTFTFLPGNDIKVQIDYNASPVNSHISTLAGFSGLPDNFRFWVSDTGTGPDNNLYFNNLQVTPEPGSAALVVLGGVALCLRRHPRRTGVNARNVTHNESLNRA